MSLSTHILDTHQGCPAPHVHLRVYQYESEDQQELIFEGSTDDDGRARDLIPASANRVGLYRIVFEIGAYHQNLGIQGFYPEVSILFDVQDPQAHYHVPLLISPFGFSTYRGS